MRWVREKVRLLIGSLYSIAEELLVWNQPSSHNSRIFTVTLVLLFQLLLLSSFSLILAAPSFWVTCFVSKFLHHEHGENINITTKRNPAFPAMLILARRPPRTPRQPRGGILLAPGCAAAAAHGGGTKEFPGPMGTSLDPTRQRTGHSEVSRASAFESELG